MIPPQNQAQADQKPPKTPPTLPRHQQAYPNNHATAPGQPSPVTELHRSEAKLRMSYNHLGNSSPTGNGRTFGLLADQFNLMRDSLNHEPLLQYQDETDLAPSAPPPPQHFTSLNPLELENMTATNTNMNFQDTPFSVSQSLSVADHQSVLNMTNANNRLNGIRKHDGWVVDNSQDAELMVASEKTRLQHNLDDNEDPNLLQLTDGMASLNLHNFPSPPTSQLIPPLSALISEEQSRLGPISKNSDASNTTNATTVTTVYAYKCNRPEDIQSQTGREHISCEERVQQTLYSFPPVTPYPQEEEEDVGQVDTSQQMEVDEVVGRDIEDKQNDTNNLTPSDMSKLGGQDDELDDDLPMFSVSKPVFPNPAELKWPDRMTLRESLPKIYQNLLAINFKKDPRMWLWKNSMGKRARELIAGQPQHRKGDCGEVSGGGGRKKPEVVTSVTVPNDINKVKKENGGATVGLEPAKKEFQFI